MSGVPARHGVLLLLLTGASALGCTLPADDLIYREQLAEQREDIALTSSLSLPGVVYTEGDVASLPGGGPDLVSMVGPMYYEVGEPFTWTFAAAPEDGPRVRYVGVQIRRAEAYLLIPVALESDPASVIIEGVLEPHEDLPVNPVGMRLVFIDDEGRAGAPMIRMLSPGTSRMAGDLISMNAHTQSALALAYSTVASQRLLISGGGDHTVAVWDLDTGLLDHRFGGHTAPVLSVAVSSDGTLMASGSQDTTVRLWRMDTRELVQTLGHHRQFVQSVAFSPDDQLLATGAWDESVQIWRLSDHSLQQELTMPNGVNKVVFSADGSRLAVGTGWLLLPGTVRILSTSDWSEEHVFELEREVTALAFSAEGQYLAAGYGRGEIGVWDLTTGEQIHHLADGPPDTITALTFFASNQAMVGSVTLSGFNTVWDLDSGDIVADGRQMAAVTAATLSPDGSLRAFGDSLGQIYSSAVFEPTQN